MGLNETQTTHKQAEAPMTIGNAEALMLLDVCCDNIEYVLRCLNTAYKDRDALATVRDSVHLTRILIARWIVMNEQFQPGAIARLESALSLLEHVQNDIAAAGPPHAASE